MGVIIGFLAFRQNNVQNVAHEMYDYQNILYIFEQSVEEWKIFAY